MKILVTGASRGIGFAIVKQLLEEGHLVVGIARKFHFHHERFTSLSLDLSRLDTLPGAFKRIAEEHPDIDVLICNAGKGLFGNLEELSYREMRSLMDLNFLSQAYLIKSFLPRMKRRSRGQIIFIGSEASLSGKRKGSLYCAAKFALRGFAQALREECAADGIRITLINPGMVKTDFFENLSFEPGSQSHEHILPEDIAKTVSMVIHAREGTVFDEINLSPQIKMILKK